ncbi:MAG TPA: endonuclease/exonuclease/phosphatase family protein [Acidimicrobiia bacterium]|jgi:endonuclease/exonuclease/phosphatase family metal-dependent hydrolase
MPRLSLATFNTHYGVLPVRRPPAEPYDLEGALRGFDADVIVLQEVWRPDRRRGRADDAAAALGYDLHYEITGFASADARWPRLTGDGIGESGIAVLTRLPLRRIGSPVVGPTFGDPAPGRRVLDVEIDVGGVWVRLVAIHLTSRLPHGPPIQLRRLARLLPEPGTAAIVAGDCNFWGPPVEALLPGWRRGVRGRTWPARAPHSQIDHVLTRPADVRVLAGQVLPDVGSDHRPVRVELEVPPQWKARASL